MARLHVVVPVWNGGASVSRVVRALQAQTVPVEISLIDDGSTDGSSLVIDEWAECGVHVVHQDNQGPAAARNVGARLSSAEWMAFVDVDDEPAADWAERLLARTDGNAVVGCGAWVERDGHRRAELTPDSLGPEFNRWRLRFLPGLFIVRRDVFLSAGGYEETIRFSENTELLFRVCARAAELGLGCASVEHRLVTVHRPADGRSKGYSSERRLTSALLILDRHAGSLAQARRHRGSYHAIVAVEARRLGRRDLAVHHARAAIRDSWPELRPFVHLVRAVAMRSRVSDGAPSFIAHLVPRDSARGAQAEVRAVCDALNAQAESGDLRHEAVALFAAESGNLRPDHVVGAVAGRASFFGVDARAAAALRRWRRLMQPTLVVAHGSEAAKYALAVFPRDQVVYRRIGVATPAAHRWPRRTLHRYLSRRPAQVLAVSSDVAADTATFGRPDAVVIPNCRDAARFGCSRPPRSGPIRLLFAGQLTASKRPELFLDVVQALLEAGVELEWSVAGDGPMRPALEHRLPPHGEMLGRCDDMPAVLGRHDILVMTSRREGEGMPGVLIEAGLSGCAAVSTDVPGARDVIQDSLSGVIVPVDDDRALIDALAELAAHPDIVAEMGRVGRAHCVQQFDVGSVADGWRRALDETVTANQR